MNSDIQPPVNDSITQYLCSKFQDILYNYEANQIIVRKRSDIIQEYYENKLLNPKFVINNNDEISILNNNESLKSFECFFDSIVSEQKIKDFIYNSLNIEFQQKKSKIYYNRGLYDIVNHDNLKLTRELKQNEQNKHFISRKRKRHKKILRVNKIGNFMI